MVLGIPLNKKQCMPCTCVTGDSISFSKVVLLHKKIHKQTKGEWGGEEREQLKDEAGSMTCNVTSWEATLYKADTHRTKRESYAICNSSKVQQALY